MIYVDVFISYLTNVSISFSLYYFITFQIAKLGFTNIIGLDPSQKSLDVCREKGCYKDYIQCLVAAEKLPIDDRKLAIG